jgi:hypothetical protein
MTFHRHSFAPSWPSPDVFRGSGPAVRRGRVPLLMAGTSPAMTVQEAGRPDPWAGHDDVGVTRSDPYHHCSSLGTGASLP